MCKNFYSISLILIKVYSQTPDVTANAKDSEVRYKKVVHIWILVHSPEKLKYVSLEIAQMEMFSLGKSEKIFQIKKFLQ